MEQQTGLSKNKVQQTTRETGQEAVAWESGGHACPHCGTMNDADALFCEECGTPLGNSRVCPHCGQTLDLLADYCEHCKSYVCTNRCSLCGATMSEGDSFCPECGSSREGVVCPACHTRSPFSYCRVCGIPLTEEAVAESRRIHAEPMWQQMDKLATELDELMKIIPADSPRQAERQQQNEELCRRVRDLLGSPSGNGREVTLRLGETSEIIAGRIAAKRRELQQMLDTIAAQPGENPVLTRNFVMARKPASTRVGWKCNFKQVVHSSPCGCSCPQLGGQWVVLTPDAHVEDDF